MLMTRLYNGFLLIAAVVAILVGDLWFAPLYPLMGVTILFFAFLAAKETCTLLRQMPPFQELSSVICVGGTFMILLANWVRPLLAYAQFDISHAHLTNLMLPVCVFVFLCMFAFMYEAWRYKAPGVATANVAGYVLTFVYVGLFGSLVAQSRWIGPAPLDGLVAFVLTIFTPKICDTGAYFAGKNLGRNKMTPILSPNKTWEGALGGLLSAIVFVLVFTQIAKSVWNLSLFSPGIAIAFGLIVGLAGMVGDLIESMIKRDSAQKDASDNVPGFGGILDVIDSFMFASPMVHLFYQTLR